MNTTSHWFDVSELPVDWSTVSEVSAFGRLWRVFMTARVVIALVLVLLQIFMFALGNGSGSTSVSVCALYLAATLAVRVWAKPQAPGGHFDAQWLSTIGVDVLAFSALNVLSFGGISYTPLFALPVLLSSVLGPILLALGTAAIITVPLLGDAWWVSSLGMADAGGRFLQAGLSSTGFFVVALLANQLSVRLLREEQRAQRNQWAARMQSQVNELVIESLADGVLVVDVRGIVRAANPAAHRLLNGESESSVLPFDLGSKSIWRGLAELVHLNFAQGQVQPSEVAINYLDHSTRRLHVRTRLTASPHAKQESLCVIFLKDLREMEARIRTEKLAAMGRMSAAVAHEIRNPLAAISQANALLEEDLPNADQRQLSQMIGHNVQRLAKIVDEVLNISRIQEKVSSDESVSVCLDTLTAEISREWAVQCAAQERLQVALHTDNVYVHFETDHLRRVLINLLDNALRYASHTQGAIAVTTQITESGFTRLSVWSDGLPLEAAVQTHLFEPFFSSESRSSGLGLYICRELCERYNAIISYQRSNRGETPGNEFLLTLQTVEPAD